MSPLLLRRQNGPGVCVRFDIRWISSVQAKRRRAAALQTHARRTRTSYGLRRQSGATTALSDARRYRESLTPVVRSKAVSRFACHRTPKYARRTQRPWTAVTRHRFGCTARTVPACAFCSTFGAFPACRQSGVVPPQSKRTRRTRTPCGLRRQSGATTALSHARRYRETPTRVARSKAVSRFAFHRTPKHARRTHTPFGLR
jgi:hypothetical protein